MSVLTVTKVSHNFFAVSQLDKISNLPSIVWADQSLLLYALHGNFSSISLVHTSKYVFVLPSSFTVLTSASLCKGSVAVSLPMFLAASSNRLRAVSSLRLFLAASLKELIGPKICHCFCLVCTNLAMKNKFKFN